MKLNDASTKRLMLRLIRNYVRPHFKRIAIAVACMLVMAVATGAMAQLMEPLINYVFEEKDIDALYGLSVGIVIVFAAKGFASFGQGILMSYVGFQVVAQVQNELFRKLMRADLAFYNNTSPGTLVARFLNDARMLQGASSTVMTNLGRDLFSAIALIGVMIYQDWLLTLITLVVLPIAAFPVAKVGRIMRGISTDTQVQVGRLTTVLDESFQGIRHVKAYGMENHEGERAEEAVGEVFRLSQKASVTKNFLSPLMEFLGGMAIVGVLIYGTFQVLAGTSTPGSFFAFITAVLLCAEPLKRLGKMNATLQEGLAAAKRIFDILDEKPRILDSPGAQPLQLSRGEIAFHNVSFSYGPQAPALKNLSITLPAGKTVALVGPSGAGKSTVLNLIPRFYDVSEGAIAIDGQDLREVTLESLRASVALVSQETILFDDTVKANIAYGWPDAPMERIEEAARNASAHDFIMEMPQGYDTMVGPRGTKLSGGQRQRVSIARAMLKDAPILLLDEATSALDTKSERQVQAALGTLMQGRTSLVIAHRLSTIVDADVIYLLNEGELLESGTHQELLAHGGLYAQLVREQFSDSDMEIAERPGSSPDAAAGSAGPAVASVGR